MRVETDAGPLRQAAELILQDERLTASLEDAQADALLRWALATARQAVAQRLRRGDPVDREAVAEAVLPVRRAARAASDLVACRANLGDGAFLERLLALVEAARSLPPAAPAEPASPAPGAPPV